MGSWACRPIEDTWDVDRGSRRPLTSGLLTNSTLCLLSPAFYPTSFLSHQGKQTLVSEAADPLQQGFHSGHSPILDIKHKKPTLRQLFPVSHALIVVNDYGETPLISREVHSPSFISIGPVFSLFPEEHSHLASTLNSASP